MEQDEAMRLLATIGKWSGKASKDISNDERATMFFLCLSELGFAIASMMLPKPPSGE